MHFNPDAIKLKVALLDDILRRPVLLQATVNQLAGTEVKITQRQRPWEPGGGSTLFDVTDGVNRYFLKVKSDRVLVESKLESEYQFSSKSGLMAEYEIITKIQASDIKWVPSFAKFARRDGFDFLLLEYLDDFNQASVNWSLQEWINSFDEITNACQWLFSHGIVHTDIHEFNLRIRPSSGQLVLVDFEEARFFHQDLDFAASLDNIGRNIYGNVGEVPLTSENVSGYSCLERLRRVYCYRMLPLLHELIKTCNFDSSCPFLASLDHGIDPRIYQSLNIPGLSIEGQRPLKDNRPGQISEVIANFFKKPVLHVDIGSNIGAFNLALSDNPGIRRTIGIEAFSSYVELAKAQAFFNHADKAEFLCAECGQVSLSELIREPVDIITIYSVYHHIKNKTTFLKDLIELSPRLVLFELAVQPECYEGHTWQEVIHDIQKILGMPIIELLGASSDYGRPIVLLSKEPRISELPKVFAGQGNRAEFVAKRVSIVLPTYNHAAFLPQSVAALLSQTYSDFELIVVNDGSTDATASYLDTLTDSRVKVVTQENRGLPTALNRGFSEAVGEFHTWTSADNVTGPVWLEQLVAGLSQAPQSNEFVYSGFALVDAAGAMLSIRRGHVILLDRMVAKNRGMASFLYRASLARQVGGYDVALSGAEDWDMWLRMLEVTDATYIDEVQYYYRIHANSMTSGMPKEVANSSRATLSKLCLRHGGSLDLNRIYPRLGESSNQPLAQWQARARLGASLIESPFAPVDWAVDLLVGALRMSYTAQLHLNLIVLLARNGRWDLALFSVDEFRSRNPSPTLDEMRRLVEARHPKLLDLGSICQVEESELVFELGRGPMLQPF